jgi:hypothetical protein
MTKCKRINICLLNLFIVLSLFTFDNTFSQSDSIIIKEFEKLKLISLPNHQINLDIVETGNIRSLQKERKVIFSKEQFSMLSKAMKNESKYLMIRVILAHELAHQVQFKYYEEKLRLEYNPILRMLLETQADILAGYYFSYLLIDEIMKNDPFISNVKADDYFPIFEKMLQIGIAENSIGTHPSNNDRYMSFVTGYHLGAYNGLASFLKRNPSQSTLYKGNPEIFNNLIKSTLGPVMLDMLSFDYGEDNIIDWSYSIAKKVINFDPHVARNIVLINNTEKGSDKIVKWHSSASYPYVEYDLEYINISSKKIYIEMDIYVTQKVDSSSFDLKIHQRTHRDTLFPREIMHIKGKLRWDAIQFSSVENPYDPFNIETARLVWPSSYNNYQWVSCSYLNEEENYEHSEQLMEFMNVKPVSNIYDIGNNFLELIRKLKYFPDDLYLGIGDYNFYDHGFFASNIKYNSPIVFDKDAIVKTTFVIPKTKSIYNPILSVNNCQLEITYAPLNNKSEALKKLTEIEQAIDFSLLNSNLRKNKSKHNNKWRKSNYRKNTSPHNGNIHYYSTKENININLYMSNDNKKDIWVIRIFIRKLTI